jgi:hypothetical protein
MRSDPAGLPVVGFPWIGFYPVQLETPEPGIFAACPYCLKTRKTRPD